MAYADFITCMFALFMVLWLLTQADLKLRQQIARYFRNSSVLPGGSLIGLNTQSAKTDKARVLDASLTIVQGAGEDLALLRGHAKEIQKALEQNPDLTQIRDNVRIQVTEEGLEIQVVDSGAEGRKDLLFDINSAALSPALRRSSPRSRPTRHAAEPHRDRRPHRRTTVRPGAQQSNWDLSFARANAARQVMETPASTRTKSCASPRTPTPSSSTPTIRSPTRTAG